MTEDYQPRSLEYYQHSLHFIIFDAHIQELQRRFEGKGNLSKIKTDNTLTDLSK